MRSDAHRRRSGSPAVVGDSRHSVFLQDPPLYVAMKLHLGDQPGPVPGRILATLQHRALGVGRVPVVVQPTAAVLLENGPYLVLVEAGQIEQIVQLARVSRDFSITLALAMSATPGVHQMSNGDTRAQTIFGSC